MQSEILKAYKTGVVADVLKAQHNLTRSFAARAFSTINFHLWKALWSMVRKKHRGRSKFWLYKNYFEKVGQNKWIFVEKKKRIIAFISNPLCSY